MYIYLYIYIYMYFKLNKFNNADKSVDMKTEIGNIKLMAPFDIL